ncbi:conserved hypothetical protein [Ricinus communis]|uniref:Uncharacterized protein n=1 Tax=Ricinus communis TaxID=3988 RepID=B9SUF6_RICCO|nr:conserved hypothetical protein [Ricinus communis]
MTGMKDSTVPSPVDWRETLEGHATMLDIPGLQEELKIVMLENKVNVKGE